jgi:hypothetical protein
MPVRTLFAVVNQDGSLARGRRVRESRRITTGQYEVTFRRDVTDCAYTAQVLWRGLGNSDDTAPGIFFATSAPGGA